MSTRGATLRRLIFGIDEAETQVSRRGFSSASTEVTQRLERIGTAFVGGYHAALDDPDAARLMESLERVDAPWRGLAYEGAGMALACLDLVIPLRRGKRFAELLAASGGSHAYLMHVGFGWALARLPRRIGPTLATLDPVHRWLAVDGYGFHEGYFHPATAIDQQKRSSRIEGYARRAFDQGLGRSLWFVRGAQPELIATTIRNFDESRYADLWSGIGLAATYAGGLDRAGLDTLMKCAAMYQGDIAQGAAFAAKARLHANGTTAETDAACEVLCGCSAREAAQHTDDALVSCAGATEDSTCTYERWRQDIRQRLRAREVAT